MLIGDVVGSVTAPELVSSLKSQRLLVVKRAALNGHADGPFEVAVDLVGAGPGTRVLMVSGSAARLSPETRAVSTDLAIVAIVDSVDLTEGVPLRAVVTTRSAAT